MKKEKVKVKSKWGYRLFTLQSISVILTLCFVICKLVGVVTVTWLQAFLPVLITIVLPMILILIGMLSILSLFGIIYLFKDKEGKSKMKKAFKSIKWKK